MVDKLKIVSVSNAQELEKAGGNLFKAGANSEINEAELVHVEQGFLEGSNVNPVEEMMALVELQRAFETSQSMIRGYDDIYKTAVSQLGRY
jgi:flagellar basal-body rod protein FlgG